MENLIICAGIHHSGSTWLYNVLRYAYINAGMTVQADQYECFIAEVREADAYVCKTHLFREDLQPEAKAIITTIRDLRDIVASAVRRGRIGPTVEWAIRQTQEVIIEEYEPWKDYTNLELRYEEIIADRVGTIKRILALIGLSHVDAEEIDRDVNKLNKMVLVRPDVSTQLWPRHCGKGQVGSYRDYLDDELIKAVELAGGDWLKEKGYV